MLGKTTKVMATVIVALFCVGAFAAVFVSDDSSAANSTQKMYVEMISAEGKLTSSQWVMFDYDGTLKDYAEKATEALKNVGLEKMVFTFKDDDISLTYDGGYNLACYYEKDGAWTSVTSGKENYISTSTTGFAIGGWISHTLYDSLTDAEKAKYKVDGTMGETWYAIKLLDKKSTDAPGVETYHVFAIDFDDKGKIEKSKWLTFDSLKDNATFVYNANKALKDKDFKDETLTYAADTNKISMAGHGFNNSSDYVKDGEWARVSDTSADYIGNTTLCLAYGGYITNAVYDTLSDSDKESWVFDFKYDETSYYYYKVTESTNGWESKNNNLVLYIVIGVVAVVAVAAIAFFVLKKKA